MSEPPSKSDVVEKSQSSIASNTTSSTTALENRIRAQEQLAREESRLLDVLERNSTLPVRVALFGVWGLRQTRPQFIQSIINSEFPHYFEPSQQRPRQLSELPPQTLASVIQGTTRLGNKLMAFNIFDPSRFTIFFRQTTDRDPSAQPEDLDVYMSVVEKPRFAARTGTWAGDGEATAQMSARAENLFGGAERIEGVLEAGTRTRNAWEVKFQSPIAARPDVWGEVAVFGLARDYKTFSGYELLQKGAHLKLTATSNIGVHDFTLSSVLRTVGSLSKSASPSIVASAGDSIKNTFSHTIVHDKRDDPYLPSEGYRLKSIQEYAGIGGGDVRYLKATGEAQYIKTFPKLSPRTHFICGVKTGLLWTLEKNGNTRITDRFFVGGPADVRGFKEFGIGPKDGCGEAFISYSATAMFPVPNAPPHWPLRFQLFANGGALLPVNQANFSSTVKELVQRPSIGAGIGLVYRTPIGRVELNFGVPVTMREGDWTRKGFQFGIGVDFM